MRLKLTTWHRNTIAVHLLPDPVRALPRRAELVKALVSGPFAIYPGRPHAVEGQSTTGRRVYTLLHLPSQTAKLTLHRAGLCRQAALEFAECDPAWEQGWSEFATGPDLARAREIHRRWSTRGRP